MNEIKFSLSLGKLKILIGNDKYSNEAVLLFKDFVNFVNFIDINSTEGQKLKTKYNVQNVPCFISEIYDKSSEGIPELSNYESKINKILAELSIIN